ncbi:MAG: primosomal protein N' (replication factor Y) - superfamily II helicase, partial [Phycisphaerae bacterium]|nr:primosomal protein N' (replication factor Y) - superfamily II helicase [Phycisphaerae bacterium]
IVGAAFSRKRIRPKSLLPFRVAREQARSGVLGWIKSRWFAPNAFKKFARMDSRLNGMYLPHWTYDCNTTSDYVGQRGDYYWETETYTAREGGRTVTKTRQVRKIRWSHAAGTVSNTFDDVLVVASHSLPKEHVIRLEPWDLESLVCYGDEYLSGFLAESYQVDLEQGFEVAKGIMQPEIERSVRHDIGGDEQRIFSVDTAYDDITFKHLLLPVWITAYRFRDRVYRVLVNGRTGEVQGERPWSWIKITLFVLFLLVVAGAAIVLLDKGGVFEQFGQFGRLGMSLAGVGGHATEVVLAPV